MFDYSQVFVGLSFLAAVSAIVGAGALASVPDFARWISEKVSSFFTDSAESDFQDYENDADDDDVDSDAEYKYQYRNED
ncbi:hypothetical protein [Xanthomonas albilineans]|uniref:hypothetical protein n=1 Tax=Xanthomonas albilineans TaxID=29447 RepID=UPI0027D96778|nr:hypothetical protein [Xanthomonas albilineans]